MLGWRVIFMGWLFCVYCVYLGHCWCQECCSSFSSFVLLWVFVCTPLLVYACANFTTGTANAWETLWFMKSGTWSGCFAAAMKSYTIGLKQFKVNEKHTVCMLWFCPLVLQTLVALVHLAPPCHKKGTTTKNSSSHLYIFTQLIRNGTEQLCVSVYA